MMIAVVLSWLLGAMLSLFFRYPVLIMASVAVLIVTGVNGIVDGRSLWFVVLSMVLSVTALQAAYFGGAAIQSFRMRRETQPRQRRRRAQERQDRERDVVHQTFVSPASGEVHSRDPSA